MRLLKANIQAPRRVKVSVKVNTLAKMKKMFAAGTELVGTSSGPELVTGLVGDINAYLPAGVDCRAEKCAINSQVHHAEQQSQQAQQTSQDLALRASKIEKITPDDNGYFELHGYARSGMMTLQNARHAQGGPYLTPAGQTGGAVGRLGNEPDTYVEVYLEKNSGWIMAPSRAL